MIVLTDKAKKFIGLPLDAQGALVSLVFNRGTSMEGDRRAEMRAIRDAVPGGICRKLQVS